MNEKLSRIETIYLIFWAIMGTGIIAIPFTIGQFTIRDGWISATLILATVPLTMFTAYLYQSVFPSTSLVEAFKQVFGRVIGTGLALWYALTLYLTVITIWQEVVSFLDISVYPKTPPALVSALLTLPIAYGVYKGIKAIGLFSEFLAPLAVIVVIIISLLSLSNVRFAPMVPILVDGWTPVLRGSMVTLTTYAFEPLVLLQFIKDLERPKSLAWDLGISLVFVGIFLIVIEIVTIGTLGRSTGQLRYPVLELVRSISVVQFIERLDTLYGMGVLATVYIKLSIYQYAFCKSLQEIFGLSSHKTIAWTASVFGFAGSLFFFREVYSVGRFLLFSTPPFVVFSYLVLPLVTLGFKYLRTPKQGLVNR